MTPHRKEPRSGQKEKPLKRSAVWQSEVDDYKAMLERRDERYKALEGQRDKAQSDLVRANHEVLALHQRQDALLYALALVQAECRKAQLEAKQTQFKFNEETKAWENVRLAV